jgi:ketosteroid isomerase-like protein
MKAHWLKVLCCAIAVAFAGSATSESRAARKRSGDHAATKAAAREALFATDSAHTDSIASLGSVEGLVVPMRDDAIYLAEGIPIVRGKREIAAALRAENSKAPPIRLSRTLAGGDASADGRFGFTFGWVRKTLAAPDGAQTTSHATYVSAWTRERDRDPFQVAAYYTRAAAGPQAAARDGFPLLAHGRGAAGVPNQGALEEQKRSLLRTDAEFAAYSVEHGYTRAFAAYAADHAMAFGRSFAFLIGRDEVLDFYKGWTPAEVLRWTPLFADSSESGDLGYTVGASVSASTKPDGTVERIHNKYLSLWARRADGAWRFVADGGATSPAPSP